MFSEFPPILSTTNISLLHSLPRATMIYHSTVNSEEYQSYGRLRQHEHHCIFHYTFKGHGETIYKGRSYFTNPGEGFFNIIDDVDSGYRYPRGRTEPWEFVVICFDGGNTREITEELLKQKVIYNISTSEALFRNMCRECFCSKAMDSYKFLSALVSIIEHTFSNNITNRFLNLVEAHIDDYPTMAFFADQLHISREHLQREICKKIGVTPAKYVSMKRFERLCELLNSGRSEKDICSIMNFSGTDAMKKWFQNHAHITIHQYKKRGYVVK